MDPALYVQMTNVVYAVMVAAFIVIFITIGMTSENAVSALIGGYSGLLAALAFVVILNWFYTQQASLMSRFWSSLPFLLTMAALCLMVVYLSLYFGEITAGHVAASYKSLSIAVTVFLAAQVAMLFRSSVWTQTQLGGEGGAPRKIITGPTASLVNLLGTICMFLVLSLGITLKYYTTQG